MNKKVVVFLLISLVGLSLVYFSQLNDSNKVNSSKNLAVNTLAKIKNSQEPFVVQVVTQNSSSYYQLANSNLPVQFKWNLPEKLELKEADTVWVLPDQHHKALDKTTKLYKQLYQFAKQGKIVAFIDLADSNQVAEAFNTKNRVYSKQDLDHDSSRKYVSIFSGVYFNKGVSSICGASLPAENLTYKNKIESILETVWIQTKRLQNN